eukprot:TRINITY_DN30198_c0_g1_i1.p1 TRINITY_DN30198_c0_g1~~TRINITY_DN30198_c0_g1_i1.p1  ORF type:complete len:600 (+),score=257.03 TRINITY_DN30198_c0_g1_i1:95-1894(+)
MDRSAHGTSLLGRVKSSGYGQQPAAGGKYGTSAHLVRIPSPRGHVLVPTAAKAAAAAAVAAAAPARTDAAASAVDVTTQSLGHVSAVQQQTSTASASEQLQVAMLQRTIEAQKEQLRINARQEEGLREEVAQLQKASQLRSEENMRRELSSLQAEIEERRKAVDTLEIANDASRHIGVLSEENIQLKRTLAALEERAAAAERCAAERAEEAQRLERSFADRQQEVSHAHKEQLGAYRELLERKDDELREKGAIIGAIEKDLDGQQSTLLEASAHNKDLQAYGQSIHDTLLKANTENSRLHLENRALRDELAGAVDNLAKVGEEFQRYRDEARRQMHVDIGKIVDGAEREIAALKRKVSAGDCKVLKLKEKVLRSQRREEELRVRLESASHITQADRARQAELHKAKEEELLNTSLQQQEGLSMKLAQTENELFSTRAALAEAKTTALMQYFSERGTMEKDAAAKADIVSEEIRSCNRLVRRILDRYSSRVEPPPGENDAKVVTLKQLLLLLQSHLTVVLEDPPPTAPTLLAWQERGKQLLAEQQRDARAETDAVQQQRSDESKTSLRKPNIVAPPLAPYISQITSRTVTTTHSTSESSG